VIARLDERRMREEVWPSLVSRQWGGSELLTVEVRVVQAHPGGQVLFSTSGWKAGIAADAEVGLFGVGGPGGPGSRRERRGDRPRPPMEGGPSRLVLQVQGSDGGLGTVVARTRMKNLALSGVILLLLVASMGALAWSTRRAQRLAELQMEFVAGVSHELRTPLTVIRSAGENLADGVVTRPDAVARYGSMVRDEGMRLSGMVEQILGYAGVESGRWRPTMERFDLAELAGSRGVYVKGDRLAIEQCIRNLADNAERHGWGLERLYVETEANLARVVVEDSGDGLELDELERLFQPFYRGKRSRQKQIKGFGLGLALVKRVAEAHGGRIWAENRKEGGARFVLELPVDTGNGETNSVDRG
jgi:signal transduction histidine kinase